MTEEQFKKAEELLAKIEENKAIIKEINYMNVHGNNLHVEVPIDGKTKSCFPPAEMMKEFFIKWIDELENENLSLQEQFDAL